MNTLPFDFGDARLEALGSGALWWPWAKLLCVSDLHFGKSHRMARLGGALLPPYDSQDTLDRLATDIAALRPQIVVGLGDSFDDMQAATSVEASLSGRFLSLMAGRRWIWIAGNHDPAPFDLGGEHMAEFHQAGLTFRHEAEPGAVHEVSGHYHPKARLGLRGRSVTRPCFLIDHTRLILPAYGTYTGGLRSSSSALCSLMAADAQAILTGPQPLRIPMPRT